jgi:voltage-gated potassium channel Kch
MRIVISGSGEVGFHLAEQLVTSHQDVVLIERDPKRAKFVADHLDCMVVQGEGSDPTTLAEAGIDGADTFIAVSNLDEINIAVHLGLIPLSRLIALIERKPFNLELVLTGRHAKAEIIRRADYVTEFNLVKHPFYRGENAREGIDY